MSRFKVTELSGANFRGKDVELKIDGAGFAIWFLEAKVAYSLSENALVDWALYGGGSSGVQHLYDIREVENRKDGRR